MRRFISLFGLSIFIFTVLSAAVAAQQGSASNNRTRGGAANPTANVNEDFELNITEERITERNYFTSTSIELGEEAASGVNLRVGVGVGANEINVLLRNVRGRVRFRASLDVLQRILNVRRAPLESVP
ncbi:MAG: hypothetical protein ACR2G4_06350 [Pyrinomonadaceae bacterium]